LKEELAGAESSVREIRDIQKQAGELRVNLDALTGDNGSVRQLEDRAKSIRTIVEELVNSIADVDDRQSELTKAQDGTIARVAERTDKTLDQVRSISQAKQKIEATKTALDAILRRAEHVDEIAEAVDRRRAEIEDAEQRMARMEALTTDLRSGLRTLRGEKAMVDAAIEKAGDLTYEVKEAEALISALKDERKTGGRLLEALRHEDEGADDQLAG